MFSSSGKIKSASSDQKPGWYYVEVDQQISDYYSWFFNRAFKKWFKPLNGCHITFIAGEKDHRIVSLQEMIPFLDKEVEFQYTGEIWTNGRAFWLPAFSQELNDIRDFFKLKKGKVSS
jgi:hypothetical protein